MLNKIRETIVISITGRILKMRKSILISSLFLLSISAIADMQKMSSAGEIIAQDSEKWSCVVDNNNSLIWEVKSDKKGVQYALNTYTWFDGNSGRDNGTFTKNCYWGKNCNTLSFIKDVNKSQLCGFSDWRLPSRDELNSIVDYYGEGDLLIDTDFFPNTQMDSYWTAISVNSNPSMAFEVPFFYGGSMARDKTIDTFVRLVRSAD
ncbi:DUF1566 domain-containing protein [Candidatus Thioglobus sp.]|nr:DUF1566 domain-containing protein [Candidatus Thioglobus sp.]